MTFFKFVVSLKKVAIWIFVAWVSHLRNVTGCRKIFSLFLSRSGRSGLNIELHQILWPIMVEEILMAWALQFDVETSTLRYQNVKISSPRHIRQSVHFMSPKVIVIISWTIPTICLFIRMFFSWMKKSLGLTWLMCNICTFRYEYTYFSD